MKNSHVHHDPISIVHVIGVCVFSAMAVVMYLMTLYYKGLQSYRLTPDNVLSPKQRLVKNKNFDILTIHIPLNYIF